MTRFAGKVCLVTGAGRGIGEKTAEYFVNEGGRVVVGDIDSELGEKVAGRLGNDKALFVKLDVRDPDSCQHTVDQAVSAFGGIDYLVNSAIRIKPGPLVSLALKDWAETVEIGLTGTFLMCQAVGRWMIDNKRQGSMVNLSSIGGRFPYSQAGAYSTVKAGVILLTQQLALEWAPHKIRVNAVAPAHIETPLSAYLQDPEIRRARSEVTPLGRVGLPEDVAKSVLFLLSDDAEWITATVLDLDGGLGASIMNHLKGRKWN